MRIIASFGDDSIYSSLMPPYIIYTFKGERGLCKVNSLYMFPFLVRVANTTKNVHVMISSNGNIAIVVNLVCLSDYVTLSKPGLCIQRYPVKRSH